MTLQEGLTLTLTITGILTMLMAMTIACYFMIGFIRTRRYMANKSKEEGEQILKSMEDINKRVESDPDHNKSSLARLRELAEILAKMNRGEITKEEMAIKMKKLREDYNRDMRSRFGQQDMFEEDDDRPIIVHNFNPPNGAVN